MADREFIDDLSWSAELGMQAPIRVKRVGVRDDSRPKLSNGNYVRVAL